MGDKFMMSVGQAHELAMAFDRNGWTNADVKRLCGGDLLARFLPIIRGQVEVKAPELPTEMTIGGRIYEILSFLWEGEESIRGNAMLARAEKLGANLGQEDCEHLLAHQSDIPAILRGKVVFVFTDYRRPDDCGHVACLRWDGDRWVMNFRRVAGGWGVSGRLLRCK